MRVEGGLKLARVLSTSIGIIAEAPFSIASTGPSARPRRTLKHNDTFAVFDSHGDMGASAGGPDGLFDHDTRYLSRLELLINGMHGDAKLPDLFRTLADCQKARSASVYDRCRGL